MRYFFKNFKKIKNEKKIKIVDNFNFFLRLGFLKTFNEEFFFSNFKITKPLLFRNKIFKFLKISESFFLKFFFLKNSNLKNSFNFFKNSLFFFLKTFCKRKPDLIKFN